MAENGATFFACMRIAWSAWLRAGGLRGKKFKWKSGAQTAIIQVKKTRLTATDSKTAYRDRPAAAEPSALIFNVMRFARMTVPVSGPASSSKAARSPAGGATTPKARVSCPAGCTSRNAAAIVWIASRLPATRHRGHRWRHSDVRRMRPLRHMHRRPAWRKRARSPASDTACGTGRRSREGSGFLR